MTHDDRSLMATSGLRGHTTMDFEIGVLGTLPAWAWMWRVHVRADSASESGAPVARRADGTDTIRPSQRLGEEIARFERE